MNVIQYKHNWPKALTPWQQERVDWLCDASRRLPFFIWPQKSPNAHDPNNKNAEKLKKLCGLQGVMNVWFEQEMRGVDFQLENGVRKKVSGQRFDFACAFEQQAHALAGEVEFGNGASMDRNLLKMADAWNRGSLGLAVFICPTAALSAIITGGGTTFEQVAERLSTMNERTVPCPILVLGLDHHDTAHVDMSKSDLPSPKVLSGNSDKNVIRHVVRSYRAGVPLEQITLPTPLERKIAVIEAKFVRAPAAQTLLFA